LIYIIKDKSTNITINWNGSTFVYKSLGDFAELRIVRLTCDLESEVSVLGWQVNFGTDSWKSHHVKHYFSIRLEIWKCWCHLPQLFYKLIHKFLIQLMEVTIFSILTKLLLGLVCSYIIFFISFYTKLSIFNQKNTYD